MVLVHPSTFYFIEKSKLEVGFGITRATNAAFTGADNLPARVKCDAKDISLECLLLKSSSDLPASLFPIVITQILTLGFFIQITKIRIDYPKSKKSK